MDTEYSEKEQDFSYSQGFLESWLEKSPAQVRQHLEVLTGGIIYYRVKLNNLRYDHEKLQALYSSLMAQSAQYLAHIQQQREALDQIAEQQKDAWVDKL